MLILGILSSWRFPILTPAFMVKLVWSKLAWSKLVWSNLYGQNLYDQNLFGQNLYGQNLYGQNLYDQNLYGGNLYGQNFYISLCGSICSNFPWLWPLSSFLFFHCQNQTHCCLTTLPLSYICLTNYHHIHIIYYISSYTSDFILPIYLWSMGYKSRYGKCVTPSLRTMIKK